MPFVVRDGNANMRRLTMFLIIHRIACFKYHELIMQEMAERGYRVSPEWLDKEYRGKQMPAYDKIEVEKLPVIIYPEHDTAYLQECLDNLKQKGIII